MFTLGKVLGLPSRHLCQRMCMCSGRLFVVRHLLVGQFQKKEIARDCVTIADVSKPEQMSLVLRFVDHTGEIKEEFMEYVSCRAGVTGEALSNGIFCCLQKYGL